MINCSYKKKLKELFHKLGIDSPKNDHFGRYIDAAVLDMEEVSPIIA